MGMFGRLASVFKANANGVINKLEYPERLLDQTILDMAKEYNNNRGLTILFVLILCGIVISVFGVFKRNKKEKEVVSKIPKAGDTIILDTLSLKTLTGNANFKLDSEGVRVGEVSRYETGGVCYVSLLFEDIVDELVNGYIQLEVDGFDSVKRCRIFVNDDVIYPETIDEWDIWKSEDGLMSDDYFVIEDGEGLDSEYEIVYSKCNYVEYGDVGEINNCVSLFTRNVKDDFIETEYLSIIIKEEDDYAFILINVGIEVEASVLGLDI